MYEPYMKESVAALVKVRIVVLSHQASYYLQEIENNIILRSLSANAHSSFNFNNKVYPVPDCVECGFIKGEELSF